MVFAHVHLVGMELFVALVLRVIMDQIAPLVLIVVMEHAQMALLAVVLAFAVEIGPQGMASLVKHAYLDLPSQIVNLAPVKMVFAIKRMGLVIIVIQAGLV
jgi:hypothetical protein